MFSYKLLYISNNDTAIKHNTFFVFKLLIFYDFKIPDYNKFLGQFQSLNMYFLNN